MSHVTNNTSLPCMNIDKRRVSADRVLYIIMSSPSFVPPHPPHLRTLSVSSLVSGAQVDREIVSHVVMHFFCTQAMYDDEQAPFPKSDYCFVPEECAWLLGNVPSIIRMASGKPHTGTGVAL